MKKITLNKDDDIGSQISVMWQCISIAIPLAKQVKKNRCKIYACMPFVPFLELLMHAF